MSIATAKARVRKLIWANYILKPYYHGQKTPLYNPGQRMKKPRGKRNKAKQRLFRDMFLHDMRICMKIAASNEMLTGIRDPYMHQAMCLLRAEINAAKRLRHFEVANDPTYRI